jgi:hypothetical protein
MAACTDLEEEPVAILAPESVFKTTRDVETAVLGAYGRFAAEDAWGRKMHLPIMLRGDMIDIGDQGTPARRIQVNNFDMDANNGMVTAFWPAAYETISAANAAIAGAAVVGEPVERIAELEAEGRFIRSMVYFHLVRLFGDIPYITEFITDPASVVDLGKTPAADVYAGIIADFEYGRDNLPLTYDSDVRSRPTRATAAAFLAEVHLTLGNYAQAYEAAKFVIDNEDTYNYRLEPDFQDLFIAEKADDIHEPIFVIDFKENLNDGNINTDYMAPLTGMRGKDAPEGWSVAVPSFRVYETWSGLDYRKSVSFDTTMLKDGVIVDYTQFGDTDARRPHSAKYFRYFGNGAPISSTGNNYMMLRYADLLLIAAEAANEGNGGGTAEAIDLVNRVRTRAREGNPVNTGHPANVAPGISQDAMRDLILEERRLELAFEGRRWYDIKRRQLGDEVFKGPNSLEPHPNFDSSRDYLFPLPGDELDRNQNLLPQNPGY